MDLAASRDDVRVAPQPVTWLSGEIVTFFNKIGAVVWLAAVAGAFLGILLKTGHLFIAPAFRPLTAFVLGDRFHSLAKRARSTCGLHQARSDRFELFASGAHSLRPGGSGRAGLVVFPPHGSHPVTLPHLLRASRVLHTQMGGVQGPLGRARKRIAGPVGDKPGSAITLSEGIGECFSRLSDRRTAAPETLTSALLVMQSR
jgi:hypothetical protein